MNPEEKQLLLDLSKRVIALENCTNNAFLENVKRFAVSQALVFEYEDDNTGLPVEFAASIVVRDAKNKKYKLGVDTV